MAQVVVEVATLTALLQVQAVMAMEAVAVLLADSPTFLEEVVQADLALAEAVVLELDQLALEVTAAEEL